MGILFHDNLGRHVMHRAVLYVEILGLLHSRIRVEELGASQVDDLHVEASSVRIFLHNNIFQFQIPIELVSSGEIV